MPEIVIKPLMVGAQARLRHPVVTDAGTLPAGLIGQIRSLHRLHARFACQVEGRELVLRIPLNALSS
jgi:hypothetical protein